MERGLDWIYYKLHQQLINDKTVKDFKTTKTYNKCGQYLFPQKLEPNFVTLDMFSNIGDFEQQPWITNEKTPGAPPKFNKETLKSDRAKSSNHPVLQGEGHPLKF